MQVALQVRCTGVHSIFSNKHDFDTSTVLISFQILDPGFYFRPKKFEMHDRTLWLHSKEIHNEATKDCFVPYFSLKKTFVDKGVLLLEDFYCHSLKRESNLKKYDPS